MNRRRARAADRRGGRRTIARLKREGQSILLVEQNIKLAFELADDVVILNTGRVAFSGPVARCAPTKR